MIKKTAKTAIAAATLPLMLTVWGCAATATEGTKPAAAPAATTSGKPDYTKMTPEALAEYLIFDANGFKLDQPTQEGATGRERIMEIKPRDLHQRVPVILGSRDEVERVVAYHAGA